MRTTILAPLIATAITSAAPLAAQEGRVFPIPAGCEGFLTVQSRSCLVAHYWRCEADPAGTLWRVSLDQDGPFGLSFTDAEYRWLESYDLIGGTESVLIQPEDDPASLTELLDTGSDSMVFSLARRTGEVVSRRDYTGFDALTGSAVEIDGERLLLTSFRYQYDVEDGSRTVTGNQFVHPEWRLFFGGIETTTLPSGDVIDFDYSPVEFVEPGERGFLSTEPQYDCGATVSSFELWEKAE